MADYNIKKIRVDHHIVGKVRGNIFHKTVYASRHFLRTPPAIALDIGSLDQAERGGAIGVHVLDLESGTIYKASIAHIRRVGFEIDQGFGRQIALALKGWTISRCGEIPAYNSSFGGLVESCLTYVRWSGSIRF